MEELQQEQILIAEVAAYLVALGISEGWVGWCLMSKVREEGKRSSEEGVLFGGRMGGNHITFCEGFGFTI